MGSAAGREIFMRNLRHYMQVKGVDRSQLAKELGISYTTLADWYNGVKYPRIEAVEKLAAYLNISAATLTSDTPEVTFDDFTYAFFDEAKELTRENKEKLLEMARFFKEQQDKEKDKR